MIRIACAALVFLPILGLTSPAVARPPLADEATKEAVVKRCAEIYHASGHPCACPSDPMRNGQTCGHRSAHDKPGGASPVCSVGEVTPELLTNSAEVEDRCHYHGR